ncbi:hypothetical protein ACP70R_021888 [Stipagrostis hirtigluma subsp. patula]
MDIVVSSVRAYLSALNKMCSFAGAVKSAAKSLRAKVFQPQKEPCVPFGFHTRGM